MAATSKPAPERWADEMAETFRELQRNTIRLFVPGLFLASILLWSFVLTSSNYYWAMATGAGLLVLTPVLWNLADRHFLAASCLLIAALGAAALAAVVWGGIAPAATLLLLPVGVVVLAIGVWVGAGLAAGCTLLLLYLQGAAGYLDPPQAYTAILAIWSVVGLIWLTMRPLISAVEWSWASSERSYEMLQQTRNYQQQLSQTIEDLKNANTQLTRLNQLTNGLRQIAEDERRAKEQFVANVSHELRTPLNMIVGFCEMILKVPESYGQTIPNNLLADLQVVLRNSQHLANLIDDVLDLSQIEAGQMVLMKERVDMVELVESAAIAVRPLFDSKGLWLAVDLEPGLPLAYCDRTRIREVLLNLLSNAGRFTEQGGVNLAVRRESDNLLISVKDTGRGISADAQHRLFQPFQQADSTTRRRYGGTGLGLSISKSFVELHDGKMWLESQEGQGTTFFVRLPIDPSSAPKAGFSRWVNQYTAYQERDHPSTLQPTEVRPRVMVIEKGRTLERLLNRYQEEMEVIRAATLETALADLQHNPARILLINSLNVAATLEQFEGGVPLPYHVPAFICSAPSMAYDADAMNVAGYLTKPITRDSLLAAIEKLPQPVKTILLVDDDADTQQLFRRMLSSARKGYRVIRADNGLQALEVLARQKVDVILLDLMMREMDGFQFMRARSQQAELQCIPVILISALDPLGHPIVSKALAVTCASGISLHKLLECVQALTAILAPAYPAGAPRLPGSSPG